MSAINVPHRSATRPHANTPSPATHAKHPAARPAQRPTAVPVPSTFEGGRPKPVDILGGSVASPLNFTRLQAARAVSNAMKVLDPTGIPSPDANAQTVRDAPDSNQPLLAAASLVAQNARLERTCVAKLSKAQQTQYAHVRRQAAASGDPGAVLALQVMLFKGALPGKPGPAGGKDTLATLDELSHQPLAPGLDRAKLVASTVRELAVPSSIAQHSRGTCGGSATAIAVASHAPAEYARIVSGLASPAGTVTLASGQVLQREPGSELGDDTGRSQSHRLMVTAFMELGNGDELDYQDAADTSVAADGHTQGGLGGAQVDRLLEAVFGKESTYTEVAGQATEVKAANLEALLAEVRAGDAGLAAVNWGAGCHWVNVTGTQTVNGVEYVTFNNPWGIEQRVPKAEFIERLRAVNG